MRIYKDVDLVEQLGSGVPRILESYGKECFKFSDNFLRKAFPIESPREQQVTQQVTSLVEIIDGEMTRAEIQRKLELKDRNNFTKNYLLPALEAGLIEMTIPDKPKSSQQKYKLLEKG